MFSIKNVKRLEAHGSGLHGEIHFRDSRIVSINTWAFASCACFSLHNWSSYNCVEDMKEVEALFDFLNSHECTESWLPGEFYFLLTTNQRTYSSGRLLIKHPNVKLRDKFENKAHGEQMCFLYRYSKTKDFSNETT